WPCETRTSICRNLATISSGLYRFLAIAVLLDVTDIPQVGPLQWGRITAGPVPRSASNSAAGDRVNRREFISLLGAAAAAWPLAARAQQPKVPTIGALVIGNISPEEFWREFRQGLRDLGYIEGQNIRFEFRSAEGHLDRLPELAAELVHLKVDVIVTWFTPTALAAKQATREIPIVMAETGDPIGT